MTSKNELRRKINNFSCLLLLPLATYQDAFEVYYSLKETVLFFGNCIMQVRVVFRNV